MRKSGEPDLRGPRSFGAEIAFETRVACVPWVPALARAREPAEELRRALARPGHAAAIRSRRWPAPRPEIPCAAIYRRTAACSADRRRSETCGETRRDDT